MKTLAIAGFVVMAVLYPATGWCSDFFMSASPLVDHPVGIPLSGRSIHAWNDGVGRWGESVGEQFLKLKGELQGFGEVLEVKNGSNNGIDRILIKRGPDGRITDFRLVEIKASRSYKPKLGKGQMSRVAINKIFKLMRKSSSPEVRSLASQLKKVQKQFGQNTDRFVKVLHVNPMTGRLVEYGYINGTLVVHRNHSLKTLFQIVQRSTTKQTRNWAIRTLAQWDQIRATSRGTWLTKQAAKESTRAIAVASQRGTQRALAKASTRATVIASKQILAKAARYAGPIAMAVAIAIETKDFVDIVFAYRRGDISGKEMGRTAITTVGSIAGGYAGASYGAGAGAVAGAYIGAFGGPVAWATVPIGGVLGGFVGLVTGGVAGAMGGGAAASYGANAYFGSINTKIRGKFEDEFIAMAFPQ